MENFRKGWCGRQLWPPPFKLKYVVIIDWNGLQIDGLMMRLWDKTYSDKFRSLDEVVLIDGHDVQAIDSACKRPKTLKGKPFAILAKTVKGKGVSFMENVFGWHGKAPNDEQYEQAIKEITNSEGGGR